MLTLEEPSERWHGAFVDMAAEFDAHGNPRYVRDAQAFAKFLRRVREEREGRGLVPGAVPMSLFWLVRDNQILGSSRLRHMLTPDLEQLGGNIGYDIRPSLRRRGFGTSLLRLTLERARALGLTRVRITCDADNIGSIRVIEKNGGALDAEVFSLERGKLLRQYWIDLTRRNHPLLAGQIDASLSTKRLASVLEGNPLVTSVRESSHYEGGFYVCADLAEATASFELLKAEVIVRGDADDVESLTSLSALISARLAAGGLRHRLELYQDHSLVQYFHHDWRA